MPPPRLCKDKEWTTDLDIQLIHAVHEHRAIWDSSSTDYHNPLVKYMSWQAIETSTGIECGVVKKRWTTLRDSFTKAFRRLQTAKQSGAGSRKVKYKYYYDMLFLAPTLRQTIELNSPSDFKDEDYSDPDSPFTVLYPEQSNEEQTASNCANSEAESTGNGDDQCSTGSPPKSPSPSPNQRPRRTKKETTVFDPDPLDDGIEPDEKVKDTEDDLYLPPGKRRKSLRNADGDETPLPKKRGRPPLISKMSTVSSVSMKTRLKDVLAKANSSAASTSDKPPLSKEDALCEAAGRLVAASLKDLPHGAIKKKIAQIMNLLATSDS
ncbi:BESS motif [Nesidiocoris tenuis]|uniref:BESS motif n=1 Tax=Nesidiocoris tenuis TaxID=355587 RepID=A0ABN7AM56_9HEMI|nr:BESS motif [Nesidiocoris tenuis]